MNNITPFFGKMVLSSDLYGWWLCGYAAGFRSNIAEAVAKSLLWEKKTTVDFEKLPENMDASDFCLYYMGWILLLNGKVPKVQAGKNLVAKKNYAVLKALVDNGKWGEFELKLVDPKNPADPEISSLDKNKLLKKVYENIMPNLMPEKIAAAARKRISSYLR